MSAAGSIIIEAMRQPQRLTSIDLSQWDELLRRARHADVLSRLACLLGAGDVEAQLPAAVRDRLVAARAVAGQHERIVRWEVNRVCRALRGMAVKTVLLKGAAYVMADLPPARGRLVNDVDIMVPKPRLDDVEQALMAHGWEPMKLDPYDQRYYRQWMHELPPMRHGDRKSVLDVHHTILPESGRLHPDPRKLFDAAVPVNAKAAVNGAQVFTLAPADMLLHSAAHLFQDGDLAGDLRDLMDLDDLLRHFGAQAGFWDGLAPRAIDLGLQRPLYYALRFTQRLLGTPVPPQVTAAAQAGQPLWPAPPIMDWLATRALLPRDPARGAGGAVGADLARLLLYIRSHWLRMPPALLAAHLGRKAARRWFPQDEEQAAQ